MEEYEFTHYKMQNGQMPTDFNPVVPDEYFARTSKTKHFSRNLSAWRD